jgi:hypothetical protein
MHWLLTKFQAATASEPSRYDKAGSGSDPAKSQRLKRRPRKRRQGTQLFEAALVLLIAIPTIQIATRIGTGYVKEAAGLNEARLLTQVVDAGATLALRNLDNRINSEIGAGNAQVLSLSDLAAEGLWTTGTDQLTALGREVTLVYHARGSQELVVLARASTLPGEQSPRYVPRGGEGVGLVGYVAPSAPDQLRGPGIDYDLTALQNLIGAPAVWDTVAVRVLRMDRDVLPFLHRVAQPGYPELNRMETDLDLNGFDLVRIGDIEADRITASVELQTGTVTGNLSVDGNVSATGDLDVAGTLTADTAQVNGTVSANSLVVAGQATLGTATAESLNTTGTFAVNQDLVVNGTATVDTLAATDLSAQTLDASIISAGALTSVNIIGGTVTANTGQIQTLVTGNCVGC